MDSEAQGTLIAIALASQRVIDALVASSRDSNDNVPCKQLRGDLQRIVVASKTLLTETLRHPSSSGSAIDDRLENWLSGKEPKICLDTLQEMGALIQSSPSEVASTLSNLFRSKDKFKQVIRIFQKRRVYFYFLLNTNIWNHETVTMGQPNGHSRNTPSTKQVFVDRSANAVERSWEKKIWSEMDQTQSKEILEWLDAWDCTAKQEETLELRQPDTCTWLLDTDEYKTWRYGNDKFLWLHGKPGSGKSVLAASVIDSIRNAIGKGERLAVFYCDFRSGRSTVAAEVMRSLLSQLLQELGDLGPDPRDILDVLTKEKRQQRSILCSAKRLASLVCHSVKQFPQPPLVVVDALDECEDTENLLDSLLVLNEAGVRLFVTSRPLQVIKDKFSRLPWLSLEYMSEEVSTDIRLHVKREVDSHRRFRIAGVMLKEEIIDTLCRKADGMFRWIECQLNTLKGCFTPVEIREVLVSLPIGLEATYEQIILAIRKEERGCAIAQRALVWLVTALRPLQLCQIVETLSIDVDRRTLNPDTAPMHGSALLDSLGSLVIHYEETDIVKLSHFSVKEYLVGSVAQENHVHHIDKRDAHAQLARQCMSYISACLKFKREVSSNEHPLLDYVLCRGFDHLSYVEPTKSILDAIVELHSDIQQHSSEWQQLRDSAIPNRHRLPKFPSPEHDFVLYILVRFAPEALLRLFLSDTPLTLKEAVNPLVFVVPQKTQHARTLLSHGAKFHPSPRFIEAYDLPYGSPIEAAAGANDHPLVDLFLEEGSPVPDKLFEAVSLQEISWLGRAHIFTRLLQTDEFMEWALLVSNEKLLTLLTPALDCREVMSWGDPTSGNVVEIARRLKQIGCDLTGPSSFTEALLRNAASAGDISDIHYLLSNLNMQLPPDILLDARLSQGADAEMTRFLIRNGANIHSVSADESTALHFALRNFQDNICLDTTKLRLLCEAGCNPSTSNLQGETPMHIAVHRMHIPAVKHLLSIGAFLPSDILFSGELNYIRISLPSSTIHLLLREGADVGFISANGDNPLHSVLRYDPSPYDWVDRLESTRMLVAAGCDPNTTNSTGETPLDLAVAGGYISVVNYLLSLNVPLSPDIFLTACSGSCGYSTYFLRMIRVLLNHGADPNVIMPNGNNALHLTVNRWQQKQIGFQAIKTLVAAGCDPSACNTEGQTVFHIAAGQFGGIKIIEYLLSRGISLPPDILLHTSYRWTTTEEIQFLIDKGANACAVTETGDTPLHLAIIDSHTESSSLQFAKLLIAAGSDPCAFNAAHVTPMHNAAARQYISVIDYLLSLGVLPPLDILLTPSLSNLRFFVDRQWSSVVRFLVYKGACTTTVTANGDTALHLALAGYTQSDCLETTKILVEAGCDIHACNSSGETPLHAAASRGHIDIIKHLLTQGASLPHDVVLAAARGGHIDAMEYLLSRGALVPPDALLAAASSTEIRWKKSRAVQFLATLEGVDLYIVASNGDTVLHRAIISHEEDALKMAKLLVDLGCDPSLHNLAGETPLHISARQHHISVLKYLLAQGVPLPSNLLLFATSGDWDFYYHRGVAMIRFLIREGANLHAVDDKGDTPVHILLRHGDIGNRKSEWKAIQMLLDAGANPYARNLDGQTPINLAEEVGPFFVKNFMRLVKEANDARNVARHN